MSCISSKKGSIQCMWPGCERVHGVRGLCNSHYALVRSRVKKGETTWEVEEAAGRCKPLKKNRWRDKFAR